MEWFFGFDEASVHWFADMIKVAVTSARTNTSLDPHCLYDGRPNSLTDWMSANGVTVHFHQVPFKSELSSPAVRSANSGTHYKPSHAAGAFLRTSAARFAGGSVFIYTDCDVMFMDDRISNETTDMIGAVAETAGAGFNSGIILINTAYWRERYGELVAYLRARNFYSREYSSYDQVYLNAFFAGQWTPLAPEFNWRPFQGVNMNASIVHFHGPKPTRIKALMDGEHCPEEAGLLDYVEKNRDSYERYMPLFEAYLDS